MNRWPWLSYELACELLEIDEAVKSGEYYREDFTGSDASYCGEDRINSGWLE